MSKRKDSDIIPFYHAFAADTNSSKRTKVMQDSIKKSATKWYDDVKKRGMHFDITNVEFDISPVAENINFHNNMIYFSGKNLCDTKEENLCNLPKDKSKYQICSILEKVTKLKVGRWKRRSVFHSVLGFRSILFLSNMQLICEL